MEKELTNQAWQYGAVGITALVFAIAVVILWRHMIKREDRMIAEREAMVKERAAWDIQEAKIRKECEERMLAAQKLHIEQLLAMQLAAVKREDDIRRNFAELMEILSTKAAESNAAVAAVMEKFYERFVGPRPRGY